MKRIRVLFLAHHPVADASSRYRVYEFLPILREAGFDCEVRPFSTSRLFHLIRNGGSTVEKIAHTLYCTARRAADVLAVKRYDLVYINREAYPFFAPWVERMFLVRHGKVIFGLDDAIYAGHDRKTLSYPELYRFKYGSGLNEVLARSLCVVAGSPVIAEYARHFNSNVCVVPTVVNLDRYPYRVPEACDDEPITIGWYGSNSTSPYLQHIMPALQRLAAEYPGRVRFNFFGDRRLRPPLPGATVLPFRLESEIADLQSIDIGIMPMPDNEWTRAKCAFKAIQYMALGIPAVVTPIGMSAEVVRHESNGLHATTVDEWFTQLQRLIADTGLRRRLAAVARENIETGYSLQVWGPRFAEMLRNIYEGRPMEHVQPGAEMQSWEDAAAPGIGR